ncbi:Serine/threonine exchanger SteT [Aquisphaera giovannonii]|uniref:Serine/threonine exchanger SteT n=1 Tax=Aquisphaera giovannonii TaxID=406548 RepID=A0A5B9W3C3_9BACT|nr:amino acid permease [Aquisphaera giovannonii]QEH34757.1 Serine/threonine exchanger SteT [Aquisphaera giovannonii]
MPAEFGLPMATFLVIGSMVGVGVLTTSGYTMALVGSTRYMLLLWAAGGIVAICGALTLAELTAALPHTGGDYVYLHHAYGPLVAFLSGWVAFLIGFSGPCAAAAFASAKYVLAPFAIQGDRAVLAQRTLATAAVIGFATIHVSGRRRTARVQGLVTGLKVSLLGLLVTWGVAAGWPHRSNLNDPRPVDLTTAEAMLFSLVYIYYAYTGWNGASYLAGEIREPRRNLPRAILGGTGGVMILYLGLNAVYGLAVTPAELRAMADDPGNPEGPDVVAHVAEIAARRLFGPAWSAPLSVAIGLMLLSTLSAYLLAGPRVVYAMAKAGHFPAIAAGLSPSAGTPVAATALQVAAALVLLWTGSFEWIVVYASVGLSLFSMLAMSSIFVLRWKAPGLHRPFRTPGYPLTPLVYLVMTAALAAAAFRQRPAVSAEALASILAGVPVYYMMKRARGRRGPEAGGPTAP